MTAIVSKTKLPKSPARVRDESCVGVAPEDNAFPIDCTVRTGIIGKQTKANTGGVRHET